MGACNVSSASAFSVQSLWPSIRGSCISDHVVSLSLTLFSVCGEQEASRLRQRAGQDARALAELKGQLETMMQGQASSVTNKQEFDR